MATSILLCALPVGVPTPACQSRRRELGDRLLSSRGATFFRRDGTPLFESRFTVGREFGVGSKEVLILVNSRRGVLVKAEENENGGQQMDEDKPFYAALEFWIQVAVLILTFGFVDAGYSGDWSRIGALSRETEAQLRTAAYVVVPLAAVLVWVIGKRKRIP